MSGLKTIKVMNLTEDQEDALCEFMSVAVGHGFQEPGDPKLEINELFSNEPNSKVYSIEPYAFISEERFLNYLERYNIEYEVND